MRHLVALCLHCKGGGNYLDAEGISQGAAGWLNLELHTIERPAAVNVQRHREDPSFLIGAAIMLRCSALKEIGGLDDKYFAYFEDNEICFRLIQSGYRLKICDSTTAYHDNRRIARHSEQAVYLISRNAWYFWSKANGKTGSKISLLRHILSYNLEIIISLESVKERKKSRAAVRGI
ncbi:MAG: hypothetical protein RIC89_01975, partial [Pseudomonadales bacterium]